MAEEKQVKSRRDQFGERLKKKYPDREYADDEALFGKSVTIMTNMTTSYRATRSANAS